MGNSNQKPTLDRRNSAPAGKRTQASKLNATKSNEYISDVSPKKGSGSNYLPIQRTDANILKAQRFFGSIPDFSQPEQPEKFQRKYSLFGRHSFRRKKTDRSTSEGTEPSALALTGSLRPAGNSTKCTSGNAVSTRIKPITFSTLNNLQSTEDTHRGIAQSLPQSNQSWLPTYYSSTDQHQRVQQNQQDLPKTLTINQIEVSDTYRTPGDCISNFNSSPAQSELTVGNCNQKASSLPNTLRLQQTQSESPDTAANTEKNMPTAANTKSSFARFEQITKSTVQPIKSSVSCSDNSRSGLYPNKGTHSGHVRSASGSTVNVHSGANVEIPVVYPDYINALPTTRGMHSTGQQKIGPPNYNIPLQGSKDNRQWMKSTPIRTESIQVPQRKHSLISHEKSGWRYAPQPSPPDDRRGRLATSLESNNSQKMSYSPENKNDKIYFVATEEWRGNGELNVMLHEKLELIDKSNDKLWSMRSCVTGSKGLLPVKILVPFKDLENRPWFCGPLSRRQAEDRLKSAGRHGSFLVRKSESKPSEFSLSVLDGDIVKHYRIRQRDTGGYFLSIASHFATMDELISHYSEHIDGLCARLAVPCGKETKSPILFDDKWELERSDLELQDVLGKGHFGIVKKAVYQEKYLVAVKELRKEKGDMNEFKTEVSALKNLHHKRLLTLFGVCSLAEPYYIVTEYLQNGSLLDYLKSTHGQYLRLEEQLHIAVQVTEGMAYLENMNYIHRDLAARNVLLDESLNSKIADFGMSKLVKESLYTASSNIRVPIKWTAIEALEQCQFSTKSDVWSFGILLSEIMTKGKTPYKELENHQVLEFLRKGNRMRQEPNIEDRCYNIMLECWAKKPENRPTFYKLQQELTGYIRDVKQRYYNKAFEDECREAMLFDL